MHQSTIPTILALASLISAAPTPQESSDSSDPWAGVIDPWGEFGTPGTNSKRSTISPGSTNDTVLISGIPLTTRQIQDLIKRESIADFRGKIPGCGRDDDPSNKDTPKPNWPVNHGYKIPKDGKDDECTTGHGKDHCWTEYYLVEGAVEYFDWQPTGSAIHCSAAANAGCSVALTELHQSCSTTGTSFNNGWDFKIFDFAVSGTYQGITGQYSTGLTYSHSRTDESSKQVCKTESTQVTCSWLNKEDVPKELCHQTWYADRVLHVWGQAQRVCNKCTGSQVQQNTGDGRVCVRGQKEFDFKMPINKLVHCDGRCDQNESGLPKPPNGERGRYVPRG
ncbi:hypothetical protein V8F20_009869 [Naviculisporaceae sp. PSN 640]